MAILKPVYADIRKAWAREDYDFTPWLATEEGIEILSDEIGIQLKIIGTEEAVGKYSADILAEEIGSGEKVIIENKYGETDHDHIGKLLTYAAGFEAKTLILIAEKFTSEHRAALDFLNNNSEIRIFGVEIKVKKINDNDYIPEFDMVSSPNDWIETMKENEREKGRGWSQKRNPWRSVDEHKNEAGSPEIFDLLRNYILSLKNVIEESRTHVIVYKINNKAFSSLNSSKLNGIYLGVDIDINNREIPDYGKNLSGKSRLSVGDLQLRIHNEKEFEESKKYIDEAYNRKTTQL